MDKVLFDQLEQQGKTVVCLAIDKVARMFITLAEDHLVKEDAKIVVDYLRLKKKMRVAMITGDNKHSAFRVADHLQIPHEDVSYSAYPADKKAIVQRM